MKQFEIFTGTSPIAGNEVSLEPLPDWILQSLYAAPDMSEDINESTDTSVKALVDSHLEGILEVALGEQDKSHVSYFMFDPNNKDCRLQYHEIAELQLLRGLDALGIEVDAAPNIEQVDSQERLIGRLGAAKILGKSAVHDPGDVECMKNKVFKPIVSHWYWAEKD